MKTASFVVHGTVEQSARWKRAAESEGHLSAGTWLPEAADRYLQARARAGRPLPLYWRRGLFRVVLMGGNVVEVKGVVSPPFAAFQGSSYGPDSNKPRTLIHLDSGKVIATMKSAKQCRELASELAPALLRGELPDPGPIIARHVREAK